MKLLIVGFLLISFPVWATDISSSGEYGPGTYMLTNDITVSSGDGLVFTGPAKVDLNGYTISTSQTGNTWDYGIRFLSDNSEISNGSVRNFRVGLKATGAFKSINVDYSARYIGVLIEADNSAILGGTIHEIGGVTDEKYAVGVNCNAANCLVSGVTFKNIYAQSGYQGSSAGEGVAVNFSASSTSGRLANCSFFNDELRQETIGIFASGEHDISGFFMHNIFRPVHSSGPLSSVSNVTVTYSMKPSRL